MDTEHAWHKDILSFPWTNLIFSNPLSKAEHYNKYLFGPSKCNHALPMTQFILNKTSYTVVM